MKRTATKEMYKQWSKMAEKSEAAQAVVMKANRAYWKKFFQQRRQQEQTDYVDPLS
jgi:hypothetical protein